MLEGELSATEVATVAERMHAWLLLLVAPVQDPKVDQIRERALRGERSPTQELAALIAGADAILSTTEWLTQRAWRMARDGQTASTPLATPLAKPQGPENRLVAGAADEVAPAQTAAAAARQATIGATPLWGV